MPDATNADILLPPNFTYQFQSDFIDALMSSNLCQVNSILNMNKRLLDLVFFNEYCGISVVELLDAFIPKREHHCGLEVNLECNELFYESIQANKDTVFNFNRANYDNISDTY